MRDGRRLAVGTLTVLPVRPPEQVDAAVARWMVVWAPVVFAPVAAVVALVGWASVRAGLPPLLAGMLGVAVMAWLTRAIHLDGLADTADGLGSSRPAVQALEIMRRGDVGPMGVVTLIVVLGLQAVSIGGLQERPWGAVLVCVALCAGRGALALVTRRGVPAARPDGLGVVVASSVPGWLAVVVWVVLAGVVTAWSMVAGAVWWHGLLAAALATAAVLYLVRLAVRRFGGITGDVLGAAVEVATTVLLVVLLAG